MLYISHVIKVRYLCLTVYKEFERLLQEQAPLEAYMEWLDIMVNTCVVQVNIVCLL